MTARGDGTLRPPQTSQGPSPPRKATSPHLTETQAGRGSSAGGGRLLPACPTHREATQPQEARGGGTGPSSIWRASSPSWPLSPRGVSSCRALAQWTVPEGNPMLSSWPGRASKRTYSFFTGTCPARVRARELRNQRDREIRRLSLSARPTSQQGLGECDVSSHPSPAWRRHGTEPTLPQDPAWHRQLAQPPLPLAGRSLGTPKGEASCPQSLARPPRLSAGRAARPAV